MITFLECAVGGAALWGCCKIYSGIKEYRQGQFDKDNLPALPTKTGLELFKDFVYSHKKEIASRYYERRPHPSYYLLEMIVNTNQVPYKRPKNYKQDSMQKLKHRVWRRVWRRGDVAKYFKVFNSFCSGYRILGKDQKGVYTVEFDLTEDKKVVIVEIRRMVTGFYSVWDVDIKHVCPYEHHHKNIRSRSWNYLSLNEEG